MPLASSYSPKVNGPVPTGSLRVGREAEALALGGDAVGVTLLQRLGRLHRERLQRQHGREARRGTADGDDGLELVGGLAALVERVLGVVGVGAHDVAPVLSGDLAGLVLVEHPLEVVADGLGVERLAVVEGHVVAQREGPLGAVLVGRPLRGELRHDLGAAGLDAEEALEHLAGDAERLAVGGVVGVEHLGGTGRTEDERVGVSLAAVALSAFTLAVGAAGQGRCCQYSCGPYGHAPSSEHPRSFRPLCDQGRRSP